MTVFTVKLNNSSIIKKIVSKKTKKETVSTIVTTNPVVVKQNLINKPVLSIAANDVNMSLIFEPTSITDAIIESKASFNIELKIKLLQEFAFAQFNEFKQRVNAMPESILVNQTTGFFTDTFYNLLDNIYNNLRGNKITDENYSKKFAEEAQNPEISFVVFNSNLTNTVGLLSPQRNTFHSPLYQSATVPLLGKDTTDVNTNGLTDNEEFQMFFFNSERFQKINPTTIVGSTQFLDKNITNISRLTLGNNQLKV